MSNQAENDTHTCVSIHGEEEAGDDRLKLLPFEQNLMVESFINDVLFIMARGLIMERLFFNHLHLYSDPRTTWFVINTTPEDEHFYIEKLRLLNPDCPPKLITADVLGKDRERIYATGGVQFVTSRILMVDLLTNKVPFDRVGGILVYRAHELLSGFQESFILRLFREKKRSGLIKAFTDNSLRIVGGGALGQLQRLLNLLYVRRVIILPRFHVEVKQCFEQNAPKLTQMSIQLDQAQRKAQASLRDIIATCVRELKQCTKDFDAESESDALTPSATLRPTKLELDLRRRDVPLTERQQRLLSDLHTLRALFHKVEDLDPTNARNFIAYLRSNKEVLENNSGWLFTQSAATLFANIDALCSLRNTEGDRTIAPPAKWPIFCGILEEISAKLVSENSDSPVLVLVSGEQLSRQLIDLVKFGQRRYIWMLARKTIEPSRRDSLAMAPPIEPVWNPVNVACYDVQLFEKDRQDLRTTVKVAQKEEAKKLRKRAKMMELRDPKQARLDRFGIQPFAKPVTPRARSTGKEMESAKQRQPSKRSDPMNIRLPLSREQVPEGMLPEDPFTSFYKGELTSPVELGKCDNIGGLEIPRNGGTAENEVSDNSKPGSSAMNAANEPDQSIIVLDEDQDEYQDQHDFSPPPPPEPCAFDDESGQSAELLPERRFQPPEQRKLRSPPPLNRSIAGAARERAEKSIHIIDEFQQQQDALDATAAEELAILEAADDTAATEPTTFNKSLQSMLVFLELGNRYRLLNCLEGLRPRHVIMYSQDIAATRAVETFKALYSEHPLELYVLMYEESSEEERYLSSIQRESEAIETLIKEQGLLMVPREFDLARDSVSQLRRLTMPQRRVDSRNVRSADMFNIVNCNRNLEENFGAEMRPIVIVDMREFNSELPTVLYRRGVDLQAATLEVGDYILSPDICCERKSLDDLAQSLANGRLFKQVEQMTKHYKRCILLVESTEKYRNRVAKIGAFQGELSRRGREARMLLSLLVRNFPQLHILWSVSPAHSAELFEELKLDQPNPSVEAALKKRRIRLECNGNGVTGQASTSTRILVDENEF